MAMWSRIHRRRHSVYTAPSNVPADQLPLGRLGAGQRAIVTRVLGGRGLQTRLAALGLTVGAEIRLIQNYGRGPLLLTVRETRLALGRGEANHILVKPC